MTPRSLVPLSVSIPFDDLVEFTAYRWTIRSWVQPCESPAPRYETFVATFYGLSSAGRGEQLRCDVAEDVAEDGKAWRVLHRAQVLNIERVEG